MRRLSDALLTLLALGILAQVVITIAGTRTIGQDVTSYSPVVGGDTLVALTGHDSAGTLTTIPLVASPGRVTVLYAFHPECAHCDGVAPIWTQHFAKYGHTDPSVRTIAVTRASHRSAVAYAAQHEWETELLSIAALSPGSPANALVAKTPWVFVFDSQGVLILHDHGARLDRVDQAIAGAAEALQAGPDGAQ